MNAVCSWDDRRNSNNPFLVFVEQADTCFFVHKANFVSQIIKKDIRNYHWYVIRDKYNLVNTHKLQDPSLLLFSYRAQHKTRKRDGKKFPLPIVELTLRGGERTAADTTVSIAIARRNVSSRRWLLHRRALRGWKALLPVAWKSISACIFNIWLDTWPRIYGHSRNPNTSSRPSLCMCTCVCVYSATSADAARDSWRIGGRRTLLEFQLIWGTVVPFVCSDQRNGSTRLQNSHSMIRPVFGCDCQSGLLFYRLDFGSSFVLTESRDTRFIYRVYLGYQIFESFP